MNIKWQITARNYTQILELFLRLQANIIWSGKAGKHSIEISTLDERDNLNQVGLVRKEK